MSSFTEFLAENKLWWILPIVIVLGVVAFVMWDSSGQGSPGDDSPFTYDNY